MNRLLKNSIGYSIALALVASMVLYMTHVEIFSSVGIVIFITIVLRFILWEVLVKFKIAPPDMDSNARFISATGDLFGTFSIFLVFCIYLSFYQTMISLIIGTTVYGVFFLLKKMFISNK